jgi:hypothetical protein
MSGLVVGFSISRIFHKHRHNANGINETESGSVSANARTI